MLRLLSKKGFTLVELICSLGIFSIIFISMISYGVASLSMKKGIKAINDNVFIMEGLKNNIIYSMSFEELEQLKNDNRVFINKENMTFDKIQTALLDVFSNTPCEENAYLELRFLKYEFKVYTLGLFLHSESRNGAVELQCNFYKGDHK